MTYVPDTNAVSALMRGVPSAMESVNATLDRRGRRLEDFDIAIAAHALGLGATLVTATLGHMVRVPGLQVENWSGTSTRRR